MHGTVRATLVRLRCVTYIFWTRYLQSSLNYSILNIWCHSTYTNYMPFTPRIGILRYNSIDITPIWMTTARNNSSSTCVSLHRHVLFRHHVIRMVYISYIVAYTHMQCTSSVKVSQKKIQTCQRITSNKTRALWCIMICAPLCPPSLYVIITLL